MTIKQKKFVKAYVANNGNGAGAIKEAYKVKNDKVATVMAVENLAKPSIRDEVAKAMAAQGIDIDSIVLPVAEGLKAKRQVEVEGDYIEVDTPDHNIRLKAAGMAAKWLGIGGESNSGGLHLHLHNQADKYKL